MDESYRTARRVALAGHPVMFLAIRADVLAVATSAVLLTGGNALAQTDESAWSFSASAYRTSCPTITTTCSPRQRQPRPAAPRRRYNYEGLDTGSAWMGVSFSADEVRIVDEQPDAHFNSVTRGGAEIGRSVNPPRR